ncbi:MAG TPA: hypothetical protein VMW35_04835 [Myxococcota bacterium]|nr:hypothetical protein [Myxococcota bacterium]
MRYAFEPCRTLPHAFVPASQRPDGFDRSSRELGFAPPGISLDESARLNVICNPDAAHPQEPCHVVLRLVTGLEIIDSTTGIASSLYQPPNKRRLVLLRQR